MIESKLIYLFHRKDGFYPLELENDTEAIQNAKDNPGTIKVTDMHNKRVVYAEERSSRYDMLGMICEIEDKKEAWKAMRLVSELYHPLDDVTFNRLYDIVAMDLTWKHIKNENHIHDLFKKKINILDPTIKVIDKKSNRKHVPDCWIEQNSKEIPVEIKLRYFGKTQTKQLLRYIKFYKCPYGIAVGVKLTVKLPKNIRYISIEDLKNAPLALDYLPKLLKK